MVMASMAGSVSQKGTDIGCGACAVAAGTASNRVAAQAVTAKVTIVIVTTRISLRFMARSTSVVGPLAVAAKAGPGRGALC